MKNYIFPLLLASSMGCAADYTLQLSGKYITNQAYHVDSVGTFEQSVLMKSGDEIISDDSEAFKFSGSVDVVVLEIDKGNRPIKVKFKVVKITKDDGLQKISVLTPGDEVIVSRDEKFKLKYELAGQSVDKTTHKLLEKIVSVKNPNHPGDDEAFGPGKPVQIGEDWEVNKENCLKGFMEIGITNPKEIVVDGKFKLNSVAKVGGEECAFVSGFMDMANAALPLPPGFTTKKSKFTFKVAGIFPVMPGKNRLEETADLKMDLSASGTFQKQGKEVPVDIVMKVMSKISKKYK